MNGTGTIFLDDDEKEGEVNCEGVSKCKCSCTTLVCLHRRWRRPHTRRILMFILYNRAGRLGKAPEKELKNVEEKDNPEFEG